MATENIKVKELISALNDRYPDARWKAAWELGEIGDSQASEYLIQALNDENAEVRLHAIIALGKIGDAQAVVPLIQKLKDEIAFVRWNAAEVLGQLKDPRAIDPLGQALDDKDPMVFKFCVKSLELLGAEKEGIDLKKYEDILAATENIKMNKLISALSDKYPEARWKAALELGEIGNNQASEYLIQVLNDENANVRLHAIIALGKIGDARAVLPLIEKLKDGVAIVRRNAAEVLGEMKDARAIDPLVKALDDADAVVLRSCVKSLELLGAQKEGIDLKKYEDLLNKRVLADKEQKESDSRLRNPPVPDHSRKGIQASAWRAWVPMLCIMGLSSLLFPRYSPIRMILGLLGSGWTVVLAWKARNDLPYSIPPLILGVIGVFYFLAIIFKHFPE